ncbi:ATP-dependent sacrificial sulfur transferase LarE [Candidatus Bathyarchaeota archaeon]|nr:MAG: ATP-dependent sacrificial sulfur transferase LarE [Candidatus Bathyarchaeota archaeon]
MVKLKKLEEKLVDKLKKKGSILVAFSGGVDSSLVLALAYKALPERTLAVTVDSPLLPLKELEDAKRIAKHIGVEHLIVRLDELKIPEFTKNPPNRCYLCKKFRFKELKKIASRRGLKTIVDGTDANDVKQYRPGLLALKEEGIYSPLLESGIGKDKVRRMAKLLKLPVFDKPSNTCLASRFPYWSELSLDKLKRVDQAESYLKDKFGVKVVRVRDHDSLARIEVGKDERKIFFNEKVIEMVTKKLRKLGYRYVTLDLQGYRFGSFDEELVASKKVLS